MGAAAGRCKVRRSRAQCIPPAAGGRTLPGPAPITDVPSSSSSPSPFSLPFSHPQAHQEPCGGVHRLGALHAEAAVLGVKQGHQLGLHGAAGSAGVECEVGWWLVARNSPAAYVPA